MITSSMRRRLMPISNALKLIKSIKALAPTNGNRLKRGMKESRISAEKRWTLRGKKWQGEDRRDSKGKENNKEEKRLRLERKERRLSKPDRNKSRSRKNKEMLLNKKKLN